MKKNCLCVWLATVLPMAILATGCGSEQRQLGPEEGRFTRQRLQGVAKDQAFAEAKRVFRQYFAVESTDEEEMTIRSRPAEVDARGQTSEVRDVLGATPNRRRQIAEMQVSARGNDVTLSCHVRLQRLDTSQKRAFRPQTGDDRPSHNMPLSDDAGTTAAQRESWTNIGRDRRLERQVLDAVRDRLQPQTAPATAPAK